MGRGAFGDTDFMRGFARFWGDGAMAVPLRVRGAPPLKQPRKSAHEIREAEGSAFYSKSEKRQVILLQALSWRPSG